MVATSKKFPQIIEAWAKSAKVLNDTPWMRRLSSGDLALHHYKGYLQETYHHAGINPQIQAFCTMFLKGNPRTSVGQFFKHATSEIGHDLLALTDLQILGVDTKKVVNSKPLPATLAFNAFATHYIQFHHPIGYLGYLFHLEFLPTQSGHTYLEKLAKLGVPNEAMTFIHEHATVDIAHNKLMECYIEDLIKTDEDLAHVIYTAQSSCALHGNMIAAAFENGEKLYG
jgi:pyrroloquinoline quinone (PQQ) biosynthesis protein C